MTIKKTYVLDTNVLLIDPNSIFSFQEHDVVIPMVVLEELDRQKNRPDEVGRNARLVTRSLDDLREKGSLFKGVQLRDGGTLKVVKHVMTLKLPLDLQGDKPDNLIIACALNLPGSILVTKDLNVRVKADSLDVPCEDYLKMRVADDPQKFYRGVDVVELPEELMDGFFRAGKLEVPEQYLNGKKLYPNQIVVIKHVLGDQTVKSAITRCTSPGSILIPVAKIEHAYGLKPRNKEQIFSLDLLFDENIKLLTLVGPSGTGKTLLALAAALDQLRGATEPAMARYDKLIVTRPVQPVGKDIGFLPGTMEEKMEPWIAPVRDNLNFLMDNKRGRPKRSKRGSSGQDVEKSNENMYLEIMQEKGLIEIEAITFIRGRSIPNAFIVIDEAQNLSMHELKTIITRAGEGTKIVLTGDIEQIDNSNVDVFTNGLSYAVEKFKEHAISGHVTLIKGERSALATLASQIL